MKNLITLLFSLCGIATAYSTIEPPIALPATDITDHSFTANWQAVNGASGYILNVFSYEMSESGVSAVTTTESFEGLVPLTSTSKRNKYIDFENSVLPEGWTIAVSSGSTRQLYTANTTSDLTLESGRQYIFTLTANKAGINLDQFSIKGWQTGETTTGDANMVVR